MPKKNKVIRPIKSIVREKGRENKHNKGKKKLYTFPAIILITGLILLAIYQTFLFFSIKTTASLNDKSQNRLFIERDGVESTLVVLESNEPFKILGAWYIVDNKRNSTGFVYYIPPGIFMKEYLNKVSEYVATGDLKYIGDSISQKRAVEYSIWQLGNLTGITPDAYIWVSYDSLKSYSKLFSDVSDYSKDEFKGLYTNNEILTDQAYTINSFFKHINFINAFVKDEGYKVFVENLDTNLNHFELINRIKSLRGTLDTTGMYMLDLGQIWATTKELSTSGREVSVVNYPQVDDKLKNVIKELKGREIEREQVKIEIYNASEISGLAGRYYRKFQNAGLEVVRYENAPNTQEMTTIYIPNTEKFDTSFELLKKILVIDVNIVQGRPDFMTTGDIVVVLGKDMKTEALWQ